MRVLMTIMSWHGQALHEARLFERLGVTSIAPWGTLLPRFAGNYIYALTEFRPQFVSLFLPMLFAVLTECRRQGLSPRQVFQSVQNVLAVGAPLTPQAREAVRQELGVGDLFDGAGNAEGLIATECASHCGHHLFMDRCYVEVVDPSTGEPVPPGRRGAIVQTFLYPYGSIHIRYDTEDVGEFLAQPCPCGRTWPLMRVYGRRADLFRVTGRELLPYDVRLCLDTIPQLLGVPYAVIRQPGNMPYLRLAIQKPPGGEPDVLGGRVKAVVREKLGVEARDEWAEEMPAPWKGVTIIEERDWGAPSA
jgi:phenylacetate-CoA ligase